LKVGADDSGHHQQLKSFSKFSVSGARICQWTLPIVVVVVVVVVVVMLTET
jgi:hypothetical protein